MCEPTQIEGYLDQLREALTLSADQREEIVNEVRGNLTDHVEALVTSGKSVEEASQMALAEIGNAYELAHKMQKTVAPRSDRAVNAQRYAIMVPLGLFALYILYQFRAWGPPGFPPWLYVGVLGFFGPVLLLTCPKIIWRRNWLFYMYPGALALVAIMVFVGSLGTTSTMTYSLDPNLPTTEVGESQLMSPTVLIATFKAIFSVLIVATLAMIQQRRQLLGVLISTLVFCAIVEIPYQIEEGQIRGRKETLESYLSDYKALNGAYPPEETLRADNADLMDHMSLRYEQEEGQAYFVMQCERRLKRGHSLYYDSKTDTWGYHD